MYKFFPALLSPNSQFLTRLVYCDNAGGSQVPRQVINSVTNMLTNYYVQPYSNNNISKRLTKEIEKVDKTANIILNNQNGHIIYGPSTTQLIYNLVNSMKKNFNRVSGEIILADFNHESMLTPFERIVKDIDNITDSKSPDEEDNRQKLSIKWWNLTKKDEKYSIDYEKLYNMINSKTRLVVIPHVSNILGNILDIKTIVKEIRKKNANTKIMVDGVAYMAHGPIDVTDMDADFYLVSFYKFCGLRISGLYIRDTNVIRAIENQNHYFIPKLNGSDSTKKLEIGGVNYENLVSINGIGDYLCDVAKFFNYENMQSDKKQREFNRYILEFVMEKISIYEKIFVNMINRNIAQSKEMRVIEDKNIKKTPLFSIKFKNYDVKFVELVLNELDIICKSGKFYSDRLLKNIDEGDVLRISFMHYNNPENVDKVLGYLNMFKRLELDFMFNVNSKARDYVTIDLKSSFDNLEPDTYYNEKRGRAYSLLDIKDTDNINIVGDIDFYQSSSYNNYNGDIVRNYKNIDKSLLNDKIFRFFVKTFKEQVQEATRTLTGGYNSDYIFVHQIRVYASENSSVNPVPEGIHKDGYNIVGLSVVERVNIQGGISNVYDNDKNIILTKQLQRGEMLMINDAKMYHDVTPIKLDKMDREGYRDIFVFTTIS
tara:strand:+ start:1766 stop:3730 length:1965 start_codon:yes stop_codon:yes gene_type:complete